MLLFLLSICDPEYHPLITILVETHQHDLIIYAKQILKNYGRSNYSYEAEDIVQNTYIKITKYCASIKFHEDPAHMKAYLKKILKNEAMTFLKDCDYVESLENIEYDIACEDNFVDEINSRERYQEVVDAIRNLKEIYSYTLSYRFFDKMEIHDIANLLGVSDKTVYTRLERGKKLLLDALAKGGIINVKSYN